MEDVNRIKVVLVEKKRTSKWLAEVGAQRVDQMIDPEQTFQMAVEDYRRQGRRWKKEYNLKPDIWILMNLMNLSRA